MRKRILCVLLLVAVAAASSAITYMVCKSSMPQRNESCNYKHDEEFKDLVFSKISKKKTKKRLFDF